MWFRDTENPYFYSFQRPLRPYRRCRSDQKDVSKKELKPGVEVVTLTRREGGNPWLGGNSWRDGLKPPRQGTHFPDSNSSETHTSFEISSRFVPHFGS